MFPVLIEIGGFPIHTYGLLIATGFLLSLWVAKRETERLGLPGEKMVDLGFWSLLIGMIGSRILYVLTRWSYYSSHPIEIFYVWEGGLVFFGGPLLNIPFFLWYTKKHKLPRWTMLDLSATSVPLAHAFGRLGCLSAGCCYGKPTGENWGIKLYSSLVEPHLHGVYLHPTQLYESASLFALFFFLRWLRVRKKFDGQLLCLYFIGYSIIRSILEIFRGDKIRGFVIENVLSTSQFISIIVILGAIALYRYRSKAWKPLRT
ncbi:MAG: prolipoprotein diacylglyceryl transferase [Bdellovibrionota bacterium]